MQSNNCYRAKKYEKEEKYYGRDSKPFGEDKRYERKIIQTPVVLGFGEKQELVVADLLISPPSEPVFRIVSVDEEVVITDYKLVPICNSRGEHSAKVIIDGYIDKNINYKTLDEALDTATSVAGPLFHYTTRIPFATFVEVKLFEPLKDNKCGVKEHVNVEILDAVVEGSVEELLDPNEVAAGAPAWAVTYNRILEKTLVRVELKITKFEHLKI